MRENKKQSEQSGQICAHLLSHLRQTSRDVLGVRKGETRGLEYTFSISNI